MIRISKHIFLATLLATSLMACGDDGDGSVDVDAMPVEDLDMAAEDFECLLQWTKAQSFYMTNLLGYQEEAVAVANAPDGGTFPVGTVIQLVPQEAMVKRRTGWNPDTNDWEFFVLAVDENGTTIESRGSTEVVGPGGNCLDCHNAAAPQWDLICGTDHGCAPIPVTPEQIEAAQMADPRCGN